MSARPLPPFLPESIEAFRAHATEHLDDWFEYYQNVYAYSEGAREREAEAATRFEAAKQDLQGRVTMLENHVTLLKQQMKEKEQEILDAHVALRLCQQTNLPTVRALTPVESKTPSAEEATAPNVGETLPPAPRSASSARISEKLPDPEKFDGSRENLRPFLQQIHAKMIANADRFTTRTSRLTYIAGRLSGKAYNLILPRMVFGVPQFPDYPDLLEYLEVAFGDPDRVQNAQNRLYRLKQRDQDFNTFLSEFQRLALEGEVPEDALSPLLFQNISRDLQDMLLHNPTPSREYHQFANHLQSLDNRYRQHQIQTRQPRPAPKKESFPRRYSPKPQRGRSPPTAPVPAGEPMDLGNQRRYNRPNRRRDNNQCFRCGSSNHYLRDCPEPDTRPTRLRQAALAYSPDCTSRRTSPRSPASSRSVSRNSRREQENGVSLS
jgi:hypothetical protein